MPSLRPVIVSFCLLLMFSDSATSANWQILHSELGASVSSQQPLQDHTALSLQLPQENAALVLGYPLNFPLVIEDLNPSVRVKATQQGIGIGIQIVLPRTIHPETKRPVTYIVPGGKYTGSGNWETLGFYDSRGVPNLQKESNRIANLLRAELNIPFNTQGQYVRQIVLFA
jgi:hypothetical protein